MTFWCLIIALDDGCLWTDRNAIRGVLSFDSKGEAEDAMARFKERHPEKSAGVAQRTFDDEDD